VQPLGQQGGGRGQNQRQANLVNGLEMSQKSCRKGEISMLGSLNPSSAMPWIRFERLILAKGPSPCDNVVHESRIHPYPFLPR
jgi:hypothetical protein